MRQRKWWIGANSGARFTVTGSYHLLPDKDATKAELKAYRLLVESLGNEGALLVKRRLRGRVVRFAIVPLPVQNLLMLYEVAEAREVPYVPAAVPVSDAERKTLGSLLGNLRSTDLTFPGEKDPVQALLDKRLAEKKRKGPPAAGASA